MSLEGGAIRTTREQLRTPASVATGELAHLLHRIAKRRRHAPDQVGLHEVLALAQLVAPGRVRKPADAVALTGGCEALVVARRECRRLLEPALSSGASIASIVARS